MQVFESLRKTEYPTDVALGFFDGVHKGHVDVIRKTDTQSFCDCPATVLTFRESPRSILSGTKKPLLTTNDEKLRLFEKLGVQVVFLLDFNEIKDLSATQFVRDVLYETINAHHVTVGFNYRFGKGGMGDSDELVALCKKLNITAQKIEPVMYDNQPISSTRIRQCISSGDIETANSMLGYEFAIHGDVIGGNHIGTTLDAPTINQALNPELVTPKYGVYATRVTIDGKNYYGATNIGMRPTVGGTMPMCETHLFDCCENLYGKSAHTQLLRFIRDEKKFDCINELKSQIEKDKLEIQKFLR